MSRSPRPRPWASATDCQTCSALSPASRRKPGRSAVSSASRRPTSCGCSFPPVESGSPNWLSPGRSARATFATVSRFDLSFARLAEALEAVRAAAERGVRTICDATVMFGGRDVRFMHRVSQETDVQIVASTGIYTYDYLPHYFVNRDVDAMAELFVGDIERGVQGTDIKAAFLKCAADEPGLTEGVEKVHRAVARASNRTGAPIMAHSRPASGTGPKQVVIFEEEGVDLARVQIAHTDDTDDLDYIESLLSRGVFIGMDRYGLDMFLPTVRRNATVAELLRRGHADRMFL